MLVSILPSAPAGVLTSSVQSSLAAVLHNKGNNIVVLKNDTPVLPPQRKTYTVRITAYSSSEDETDDTPFIMASGKRVHDGVIAANFLPFGTQVIIPSIFGDKVFIVEDRMNKRKTASIDVWMSSKGKALRFGVTEAGIVILKEPDLSQIAEK